VVYGNDPKSLMASDFGLRVYPNPASQNVQVSSAQELTDAELDILDNQGRSVHAQRATGTLVDIDVSQLSSGRYTLRLRTEREEYTTSFSVAH